MRIWVGFVGSTGSRRGEAKRRISKTGSSFHQARSMDAFLYNLYPSIQQRPTKNHQTHHVKTQNTLKSRQKQPNGPLLDLFNRACGTTYHEQLMSGGGQPHIWTGRESCVDDSSITFKT